MLLNQNLAYDTVRSWELDGEIPDHEDMRVVETQRDWLQSIVDRYTKAIMEWQNDERIRYRSTRSQESKSSAVDVSGD